MFCVSSPLHRSIKIECVGHSADKRVLFARTCEAKRDRDNATCYAPRGEKGLCVWVLLRILLIRIFNLVYKAPVFHSQNLKLHGARAQQALLPSMCFCSWSKFWVSSVCVFGGKRASKQSWTFQVWIFSPKEQLDLRRACPKIEQLESRDHGQVSSTRRRI